MNPQFVWILFASSLLAVNQNGQQSNTDLAPDKLSPEERGIPCLSSFFLTLRLKAARLRPANSH